MTQFENQHQTFNSQWFLSGVWGLNSAVKRRAASRKVRAVIISSWFPCSRCILYVCEAFSVGLGWQAKKLMGSRSLCMHWQLFIWWWIPLMGSLATLTSLQANPSKGILLLACQAVCFGGDASLQDSWWGENRSVQDGTWIKRKQ